MESDIKIKADKEGQVKKRIVRKSTAKLIRKRRPCIKPGTSINSGKDVYGNPPAHPYSIDSATRLVRLALRQKIFCSPYHTQDHKVRLSRFQFDSLGPLSFNLYFGIDYAEIDLTVEHQSPPDVAEDILETIVDNSPLNKMPLFQNAFPSAKEYFKAYQKYFRTKRLQHEADSQKVTVCVDIARDGSWRLVFPKDEKEAEKFAEAYYNLILGPITLLGDIPAIAQRRLEILKKIKPDKYK